MATSEALVAKLSPRVALAILFVFALSLLTLRARVTGSLVAGDSARYFMTARSLGVDHDLDFSNEYRYFANQRSSYTGNPKLLDIPPPNAVTGKLPNGGGIGTALSVLPFYGLAWAIAPQASKVGEQAGYGLWFQWWCALGSLLYGILGVVFLFKLLRTYYARSTVYLAVSGVLFATPLFYYLTLEPLMSHAIAFATVTAFLWQWNRMLKKDALCVYDALILGSLGGWAAIVRFQDAPIIFLPLVGLFFEGRPRWTGRHFFQAAAYVLAALGAVTPQLWANFSVNGSLFDTGHPGQSGYDWFHPDFFHNLLDPYTGILFWSPILLLSVFCLRDFKAKSAVFGWGAISLLATQWCLLSSVPDQGGSPGTRMLLSYSGIFALGLCQGVETLSIKRKTWVMPSLLFLILLNAMLTALFCLRIIQNPHLL